MGKFSHPGTLWAAAAGGVDSVSYDTYTGADVTNRFEGLLFEGFNGSTWDTIYDHDVAPSKLAADTTYTFTNGVDYTDNGTYTDFRITFHLSTGAANLVREVRITVDGTDVLSGNTGATETPSTSNDPDRMTDGNSSTQYPNAVNVNDGQIVEFNI